MRRFPSSSVPPTRREVNNALRGFALALKGTGFTAKQPIPDYQEKRVLKRTGSSEAKEQVKVINWWNGREERRGIDRKPGAHEKYGLPAFALFHVPNGGGRLSGFTGARLKAMGLRPGVPDLQLPVRIGSYAGAFAEMKYGKNRESSDQIEFIAFLRGEGYCVRTCWGADEAIAFLTSYLEGRL